MLLFALFYCLFVLQHHKLCTHYFKHHTLLRSKYVIEITSATALSVFYSFLDQLEIHFFEHYIHIYHILNALIARGQKALVPISCCTATDACSCFYFIYSYFVSFIREYLYDSILFLTDRVSLIFL